MKRFTLVAAAFLMMSGSMSAQKRFVHQQQRTEKAQQPVAKMQVKKAPSKVHQAAASLFMPLREDVYYYEEEWMKTGENNYTYDTHGNVLTSNYVTDEGTIRTEYVYNENDLWVSKTETNFDEEGNQISATRQTRAYDNVVKSLVVENM